jgi:hypothetical protein
MILPIVKKARPHAFRATIAHFAVTITAQLSDLFSSKQIRTHFCCKNGSTTTRTLHTDFHRPRYTIFAEQMAVFALMWIVKNKLTNSTNIVFWMFYKPFDGKTTATGSFLMVATHF